ncbi:hypothetical protein HK100_012648 [Physocladia obscura]|uniref:Carboxylic ester hydrolase n=1 Tax=Physocladia obscura TaxID=109957 RepID=A0AAD5SZI2_9FUNG|nr:hypothetical protein HK100_012648 [Physocladia obscura]
MINPIITSLFLLVLQALTITAAPTSAAVGPTVVLRPGKVIGTTTVLGSSATPIVVNKFLGIPFAVTPPKRFLPPEPLYQYSGPVNATAFKGICIQQDNGDALIASETEDCLYLNVYAPSVKKCDDDELLPVLFWIHGGDLKQGTGAEANVDGSSFVANQNVVVVTINYRLNGNVFGFSNAPNLAINQRNVGFLDQRFALQWVQDNIAAFGGDPAKVTIFGESSGASSVDRILTAPPVNTTQPLFRAAILESGQATVSAFANAGGPTAWSTLVNALNCTVPANSTNLEADEFSCVQAADTFTIRSTINANSVYTFSPVNDNVTQQATPFLAAREAGNVAKVPILIGSNGQEGLLLAIIYLIPDFSLVTLPLLEEVLYSLTGSITVVESILPIISAIQAEFPYFDLFEAVAQVYTEAVYQCPAKLVASATTGLGIPTWRYYFNATIPNLQYPGYPSLGAYHGSDVRIVWGTYPAANATNQEIEVSKVIQTAWATFAKDPWSGPGWTEYGQANNSLACLGCNGTGGVELISDVGLDSRCAYYESLYAVTTTPFF